jgi:RNA polymerase sigma-70 factor (ECF subfamily)
MTERYNNTMQAEADLVRRVQTGDQGAFQELVERYQSRIFAIVHRILRNREDTEDIAQQVFTKVYFGIKNFDCRCSLITWMYRIAVNECCASLRRKRLDTVSAVEEPSKDATGTEQRFGAAPGQPVDRATVERDLVNKLLDRLPEGERLLLVWKEVEGHSIGELVTMTGLTASAIKIKLFRTRHKLLEIARQLSVRPETSAVPGGFPLPEARM